MPINLDLSANDSGSFSHILEFQQNEHVFSDEWTNWFKSEFTNPKRCARPAAIQVQTRPSTGVSRSKNLVKSLQPVPQRVLNGEGEERESIKIYIFKDLFKAS